MVWVHMNFAITLIPFRFGCLLCQLVPKGETRRGLTDTRCWFRGPHPVHGRQLEVEEFIWQAGIWNDAIIWRASKRCDEMAPGGGTARAASRRAAQSGARQRSLWA